MDATARLNAATPAKVRFMISSRMSVSHTVVSCGTSVSHLCSRRTRCSCRRCHAASCYEQSGREPSACRSRPRSAARARSRRAGACSRSARRRATRPDPAGVRADRLDDRLDHITFRVADYKKEAAFYIALMGWTLRSDDGKQAVLDIGDWGTVIFKQAPADSFDAPAPAARGRSRARGRRVVRLRHRAVEREDRRSGAAKRGLTPVADNDGKGFESFHVKDPDGFDLQISNGNGYAKARRRRRRPRSCRSRAPFESTGWKTVWLDHFSFNATNYKESASFYMQPARLEADLRRRQPERADDRRRRRHHHPRRQSARSPDVRARRAARARRARIDHISFGISPWDTDGVKAELEKRGLRAQIDTSSRHQGRTAPGCPTRSTPRRSRAITRRRRTATTCRSATSRTTTGWRCRTR